MTIVVSLCLFFFLFIIYGRFFTFTSRIASEHRFFSRRFAVTLATLLIYSFPRVSPIPGVQTHAFSAIETRLYSVTIWQQPATTRYINREIGIEKGINRRIEKWERMDRMVSRFQSFKAIVILGQFHQLDLVKISSSLEATKRVPTFANIFRYLELIWSRLNDNDPISICSVSLLKT